MFHFFCLSFCMAAYVCFSLRFYFLLRSLSLSLQCLTCRFNLSRLSVQRLKLLSYILFACLSISPTRYIIPLYLSVCLFVFSLSQPSSATQERHQLGEPRPPSGRLLQGFAAAFCHLSTFPLHQHHLLLLPPTSYLHLIVEFFPLSTIAHFPFHNLSHLLPLYLFHLVFVPLLRK